MKSSRRRASRALIGILVVTLVLGLILHFHNLKSTSATETAAQPAATESAPKPAVNALAAPAAPVPTAVDIVDANPVSLPAAAPATRPSTTQPTEPMLAAVTKTPLDVPAAKPEAAPEKIDNPIAAANAKRDEGSLIAARKILREGLANGTITGNDVAAAKHILTDINSVVVFSSKRFPEDEFGGTFTVPPGGVLAKISHSRDVTPDLLMRVNGITDPRRLRAGQAIKILKGPFNAIIYKSAFALELWQGEPNAKGANFVMSFQVGLGKEDSTPTGTWAVQNKLKNPAYYSPRGEGVIAANDPKNPLGEYWIGLTGVDGQAIGKSSYGIHGTIDSNSIGKQESMGCIRLKNEDVQLLFETLVEGKSTVIVKD